MSSPKNWRAVTKPIMPWAASMLENSRHAFDDAGFEAFEFAVGEVEEVAGAAGGVEDRIRVHALEQFGEALEGFGVLDLLRPGVDDRRLDDLHDVDGGGEVGAVGVAGFFSQRVLEEGAEDFRADLGPVGLGGFLELVQFVIV